MRIRWGSVSRHLCRICADEAVEGSACCQAHQPSPAVRGRASWKRRVLPFAAAALVLLLALGLTGGVVHGRMNRARMASITPTATRTPRPVTPTPSTTPTVTATPSPTPTPTPAPTPTPINPAVEADLSADDVAVLAALIRAEAGGMHAEGQYLVACNVLADLYLAEGDWNALCGRWSPLEGILAGNSPVSPQGDHFAIANGAADGEDCRHYPRCRFLGSVTDVHAWQANGWVEPGRYDLWLGPGGQMLVCISHGG